MSENEEMEVEEDVLNTPIKREKIAEHSLMALEKLERSSPDLWPEKLPGMADFISMKSTSMKTTPNWGTSPSRGREFNSDDINEMHQMASLPPNALILEIKNIFDQAYELGLKESKVMTLGKYIGVFTHGKRM